MILLGRRNRHEAWRLAVIAALAGVLPSALYAQAVEEIQVTPETMKLRTTETQTIFVAAYDQRGNLVPGADFSFWSSDTSVAQVMDGGVVLGVRPGLAKVEVRAQGRSTSLAVLVVDPEPDPRSLVNPILTIDPPASSILPGERFQLHAQLVGDDGVPVAPGHIVWKSLKPGVVTVDGLGVVTGMAVGQSIVQAVAADGLMATAPVEVAKAEVVVTPSHLMLPVGARDTVRVLVPDHGNRRLQQGIDWRSNNTSIATVSDAGVVKARSAGTVEIVASGFGHRRRITVVVHKVPASLVVSPLPSERVLLPPSGTVQFAVVVEAADSSPIPEIGVGWTLRDTMVASFNPATGTLTAKAIGFTSLIATVPGFAPVIWGIRVVPGVVRLRRRRLGMIVGGRDQLVADLVDVSGLPSDQSPRLRWVSDLPSVVTVDTNGTLLAKGLGRATIIATTPWRGADTAVVFVTGDLLVTSDRDGRFGLYTLRQSAPDMLFPVLRDSSGIIDGVYAPDRTHIAFSARRNGSYDLYVANADGTDPRPVAATSWDETDPVWLPDGSGLLYLVTGPNMTHRIQRIALDGAESGQLAAADSTLSLSAVAPDARRLAFTAVRDKKPDLYLVNLDGTDERRITDNDEEERFPGFFPNGDVLYAQERNQGRSARIIRHSLTRDRDEKLFDVDGPLLALAVSRDGEWLAYAVETSDISGPHVQLYLHRVASEAAPIAVRLRPNERILDLSF